MLVTGASGFIGARLVRRLVERQCRVTCLVRAGSCADPRAGSCADPRADSCADPRFDGLRAAGARLVTGDVTDHASAVRALAESKPRAVFHLAGCVRAMRRPDFMSVNAGGVESVAAACAGCADPPVLVVVSSLAAAGPCPPGELRAEGDVAAPVSDYGRSKLAGERAASRYAGAVPISIVRPPIVFGPGDRGVLEVFRPIARWGVHVVPGRGAHRCSLVHVDDLVEGLLLAAERGERLDPHGAPGQGIYFIAGEDRPTFVELGQAVAVALGRKPATVIHVPGPLARLLGCGGDVASLMRRRAGWVSRDKITEALAGSWTCSAAKARAHLGWSPAAGLAERLSETARWYREAGWL